MTGVLFGVRLLQESRKDRLALFSVTGDRATRRFLCRLSTEGGVPMPELALMKSQVDVAEKQAQELIVRFFH